MKIRVDSSVNTKCPAKDKNTPRQKISSKSRPQTIAATAAGDFSAGQSCGTSQTAMTANDRKCRMRSTSRLALSIG